MKFLGGMLWCYFGEGWSGVVMGPRYSGVILGREDLV